MDTLKMVFSTVWLLGWGFGAGALLTTHWYISVPMFLVAALPISYDIYMRVRKKKNE